MLWKFLQIKPQPARGKLREEMWESPEWIAEEKYDGDRRIAQFCGKVVRFTGRRISVKDGLYVEKTENVPHLSGSRALASYVRQPPTSLDGTVLDGEMVVTTDFLKMPQPIDRGGFSKYVTSIMGSLPEEAVAKQIERGWLRYVVFDCLYYKGKDIRNRPLAERRARLIDAVGLWNNPFVSGSDIPEAHRANPSKRKFYESIVNRGGEGVILKHIDHRYGDKSGWVKVKKQATADVVIMGFVPAKEMSVKKGDAFATMTKYAKAGLIGAIQCGQYVLTHLNPTMRDLTEVTTVSGMGGALRAEFTAHPKKYIGKVVEIEHNGREPTGRFRHPRFNRFRDDKRAIDCVYREDES